jgi:hypothetical protein
MASIGSLSIGEGAGAGAAAGVPVAAGTPAPAPAPAPAASAVAAANANATYFPYSNDNGDYRIRVEEDGNRIHYALLGQIVKRIRNNITSRLNSNSTIANRNAKRRNIQAERLLVKATVELPGYPGFDHFMTYFDERVPTNIDNISGDKVDQTENKKIIEGKKVAFLPNFTQVFDKNLTTAGFLTGTTLTTSTKNQVLKTPSLLTGKNINKEKGQFFLRKGIGENLLRYMINDLRRRGFDVFMLHAANRELEGYYRSKGGFVLFPQATIMEVQQNYNNYTDAPLEPEFIYHGMGSSGRLMYRNLNDDSAAAATTVAGAGAGAALSAPAATGAGAGADRAALLAAVATENATKKPNNNATQNKTKKVTEGGRRRRQRRKTRR